MGIKIRWICSSIIIFGLILLWARELWFIEYKSVIHDNATTINGFPRKLGKKYKVPVHQSNWKSKLILKLNETNDTVQNHETFSTYLEKLNKNIANVDDTTGPVKSRRIREIHAANETHNSTKMRKEIPKIPHGPMKPHTKEEFEDLIKEFDFGLELRAGGSSPLPGDSSSTFSPFDPDIDDDPRIDPEILRKGCIPVPRPPPTPPPGTPPGPPPPPVVASDFPPCPFEEPSTEEPIPLVQYKGRLRFDDPCIPDTMIAQLQLVGQSKFSPSPTDVETGLTQKVEEVEAQTCDQTRGLQCIEVDETNEGVGVVPKFVCRCMAAFGQETVQRLNIDGKCYIPAGKGRFSDCFDNAQGFPLPTGDTTDYDEWNPVTLPCVPNAICRENSLWFGKRCVCLKKFFLESAGTCSKGTLVKTAGGLILVTVGLALTSLHEL